MEQRISLITLGVADVGRARTFYEKAGYAAASREFDDGTGIPHLRMEKNA